MAKEKAMNYTPEQTAELVAAYTAVKDFEGQSDVIATFAETFGKSVASVRQKLVREGVYQKREYLTKQGEKPESKEDIVSDIAKLIDSTDEMAESLAKANKGILVKIREALSQNKE